MTDNFAYTHLAGLDSTVLDLVAYNENTEELFVRFVNESERVYADVPKDTYLDLVDENPSAGRYYNYAIKGTYTSVEVEDTNLYLVEPEPEVDEKTGPLTADQYNYFMKSVEPVPAEDFTYSVTWEIPGSVISGSSDFNTTSDTHALSQFSVAMYEAGIHNYKVLVVSRYFE